MLKDLLILRSDPFIDETSLEPYVKFTVMFPLRVQQQDARTVGKLTAVDVTFLEYLEKNYE